MPVTGGLQISNPRWTQKDAIKAWKSLCTKWSSSYPTFGRMGQDAGSADARGDSECPIGLGPSCQCSPSAKRLQYTHSSTEAGFRIQLDMSNLNPLSTMAPSYKSPPTPLFSTTIVTIKERTLTTIGEIRFQTRKKQPSPYTLFGTLPPSPCQPRSPSIVPP